MVKMTKCPFCEKEIFTAFVDGEKKICNSIFSPTNQNLGLELHNCDL